MIPNTSEIYQIYVSLLITIRPELWTILVLSVECLTYLKRYKKGFVHLLLYFSYVTVVLSFVVILDSGLLHVWTILLSVYPRWWLHHEILLIRGGIYCSSTSSSSSVYWLLHQWFHTASHDSVSSLFLTISPVGRIWFICVGVRSGRCPQCSALASLSWCPSRYIIHPILYSEARTLALRL